MNRHVLATVASMVTVAVVLSGCGSDEPEGDPRVNPPPTATGPGDPPELTDVHEVIATDLDIPWDIEFLPDGAALVTQRPTGRILRVGPESDRDGLLVEVAHTIEGVNSEGEGGLLGIAVSPEYDSDGLVFAYYSTDSDNRIVRFSLGEESEPILTGIPHSPIHNGGALEFGPDGHLYATAGDANVPERAQDPDNLAGSILRMTTDGEPAPDNPFENQVWAYGLRNPQGLAWDPAGRLWATEFGRDEWDELNQIEAGTNYGWPTCEGSCDPPEEDLADPVVTWRPEEASCSGLAAVDSTLVAACLRGQRLWLLELTDNGTILGAPRPALDEEYGRLRAVAAAPDGSLWVTTSNRDSRLPGGPQEGDDRIIRLVVSGTGTAGMA